jgi:hypothetical protein
LILSCKPVRYTYTGQDGISHEKKSYTMAGDRQSKKNKTYMTLGKFNKNDINKNYENIDSMMIQEITVNDLKTQFTEFDYTLISIWYPCNGTMTYEVRQYIELVDTLMNVSKNSKRMAFVFASLTYDFYYLDLILKSFDYHLQSYVIPSSPYHEKVYLKSLSFIKELNGKNYEIYKDDSIIYTVLLLNKNGEVIKMIEPKRTDEGKKVIKDFDLIRNELIELVKY